MDAKSLFYKMHLIREAENAIIREYPKNEIKTPCHLAIGAEAIAVGVCSVFPKAKLFASYRNHHWYLACGGSLINFFLELYGRHNPIAGGKAGSMHLNCPDNGLMLSSAVVSTQLGPAVGYAFGSKFKELKPEITIVAFGDGAVEEGAFHEAMNIASLYELPILFVLEDNGLAIHQTPDIRQAFDIEKLVSAYQINYRWALANRLDSVLETASFITKLPAFLHLSYHRFLEHVGINEDYSAGYRGRPISGKNLDPVEILANQDCVKELTEVDKEQIVKQARLEVQDAVFFAYTSQKPPISSLLENVFSA